LQLTQIRVNVKVVFTATNYKDYKAYKKNTKCNKAHDNKTKNQQKLQNTLKLSWFGHC